MELGVARRKLQTPGIAEVHKTQETPTINPIGPTDTPHRPSTKHYRKDSPGDAQNQLTQQPCTRQHNNNPPSSPTPDRVRIELGVTGPHGMVAFVLPCMRSSVRALKHFLSYVHLVDHLVDRKFRGFRGFLATVATCSVAWHGCGRYDCMGPLRWLCTSGWAVTGFNRKCRFSGSVFP